MKTNGPKGVSFITLQDLLLYLNGFYEGRFLPHLKYFFSFSNLFGSVLYCIDQTTNKHNIPMII